MNDRIVMMRVNGRPSPIRLSPIDVSTTDWSVWSEVSSNGSFLYVDGRRYEAPDGVPVELQPKLAITAFRCGAELAGAVDQVNGPSSRERRASVSHCEARIIGECWAREILKYAEHLRSGGLFCSHGSRLRTHGWTRLNVLQGAGLLSVDDIDFLFDEIGHRMGIEPEHRRPEDYSERLLGAIKHMIPGQR